MHSTEETKHRRGPMRAARRWAVLAVLGCVAVGLSAGSAAARPGPGHGDRSPVVTLDTGTARGIASGGVQEFRGLPYAAPPVGDLRWRAPQPAARWHGVRDATSFSPVCPQQPPSDNGSSEDCLYLNVTAPTGKAAKHGKLPVIVWLHGGGFELGEGADYDATKLAAEGAVVVTINYRLGWLGFLSHPSVADRSGASGNYGLMDQQAALRWVQRNARQLGGDPRNVTLAGQSAGGLSVLQQLVSPGAKGLFQRAVVESGAFAPQQKSLRTAEAEGKAFATSVGCADQSARCLRALPVDTLVAKQPSSITPGVVDGTVVRESVGPAIAAGRFHRVPLLNGSNTVEERLFTVLGINVSKGATVALPEPEVTESNYLRTISSTFGASRALTARIAAEYPLEDYATPGHAFSAASSDANFSCPALDLDRAASRYVPTFAYELNDPAAPERFVADTLGAPFTPTHQTELQYLFDLPYAPIAGALSRDQEKLASTMRGAWVQFADVGSPSTRQASWPTFDGRQEKVLSLVPPKPHVDRTFADRHHCDFWSTVG